MPPRGGSRGTRRITTLGVMNMTKRVVVLSFSCLLSAILLLTSCGQPAATTTTTSPTTAQPTTGTPTTAPGTTAPVDQTPKYGGTLTSRLGADPVSFDSGAKKNSGYLWSTVYQQYMGADWRRGPAGSNEANFASGGNSIEDFSGPELAESWEMPEMGVWKLNIRQGVRWQKPDSEAGRLVNGRQLTAADIVSSLNRLL